MSRHRSVSLNNEIFFVKLAKIKLQFVRKLWVYGAGRFGFELSVLERIRSRKIFQFEDMYNESERYQDASNGL
jgi:hypothetical protein